MGEVRRIPKRLTHKKPPLWVRYTPMVFWFDDSLLMWETVERGARRRADLFADHVNVKRWEILYRRARKK